MVPITVTHTKQNVFSLSKRVPLASLACPIKDIRLGENKGYGDDIGSLKFFFCFFVGCHVEEL